jgi:mannose-1-phosphate guanylyltransferase
MRAMILAAGRGTRLAALGLQVPKALVEVGGEPLLERQLRYLARHGVTTAVVNAHHLAEQVEAFAAARSGPPQLVVVREPVLLGTAGGVRGAIEHLGHEPFLVLYADVLIDEPLAPLVEAHRAARADVTLTVYEAAQSEGKGVVEVDGAGRIERFVEKGPSGPGLINAGLYVLEPAVVSPLPLGEQLDFGHDVFPDLLARGATLLAYRLAEPVIDVGTPDALALARERLAAT